MSNTFAMVRFISLIKKLIVLLVFLPFTTSDSMEDYPLNPRYDETKYQRNAVIELLQLSNKQTIKNNFDNWISQNPMIDIPLITINSKNITFTKFIIDEDIVPISSLTFIDGNFNSYTLFQFKNIPKVMQVGGTVQFLRSGNCSSRQISFNFNFTVSRYDVIFNKINNPADENKEIETEEDLKTENFMFVELDEKSCNNIDEEQLSAETLYDDVLQAMKIAKIKRIKLMKKSVFQSICNKAVPPVSNSNSRRQKNDNSLLKSHNNIGTFPWLFDHNEFNISGLNNFDMLEVEYSSDGSIFYDFQIENVQIHWNIASVTMMLLSFDIPLFGMQGSTNNLNRDEDLDITLYEILEVSEHGYVEEKDEEFKNKFQALISNGMKQTIQKFQCDGNKEFIGAIRRILRPFDEKLFEKSLINIEASGEKNTPLGEISISKLDIQAFHLKNITWLYSNKIKVYGTLSYEKISSQAVISLPIQHDKVHSVPVSVNLFIKETTIGISFTRSNFSNDDAVQISPNWRDTDTTITITSNHYQLSRQERIAIGNQTFHFFIRTMENQIIDVTKLVFRPIFDIHKTLFDGSTLKAGRSNDYLNQQRCVAFIQDYWDYTTTPSFPQAVDIAVKGSWNVSLINIHYVNRKLSIGGLQLENVRVKIKQLNDLDNSVTTDYAMDHLSITINHSENDVLVTISSFDQNATIIIEKLESTVAKFIRHLIYSDLAENSNYYAKYRELVNETTTKSIQEDMKSQYDASLQFTTDLAQILQIEDNQFDSRFKYEYVSPIFSDNDYISNQTICPIGSGNASFGGYLDLMIQEEMCVYLNNSLITNDTVGEQLVINGKIYLFNYGCSLDVNAPFVVTSDRGMDATDDYDQENSKLYIDDKNMEGFYEEERYNKSGFDPNIKTSKTAIALLMKSALGSRLKEVFPSFRNSCKRRSSSFAPPEKYFFSIANTVNYPSQLFSMYHIKLYGLHYFKMLRTSYSRKVTEFEIVITNLTARIIWNHFHGDYIRRTPKMTNLEISEITLCAKVLSTKRLIFTVGSRLLISGRENSTMVNKLQGELEKIIINAIQQAIQQEYY